MEHTNCGTTSPPTTLMKQPVGRPRVRIKPDQVQDLRCQGASWRKIAKIFRIGTATAMRLLQSSRTTGRIRDCALETLRLFHQPTLDDRPDSRLQAKSLD